MTATTQSTGKVKWFSAKKGYGFIENDQNEEIFVHYSQIKMEGYKKLRRGEDVVFNLVETENGKQAQDVQAVAAD
jgi:CspA family cold shock protein|tara:strand:- start:272 stop:496 length:225 start_codon:yes stop_codon:yes gene_type:complete